LRVRFKEWSVGLGRSSIVTASRRNYDHEQTTWVIHLAS